MTTSPLAVMPLGGAVASKQKRGALPQWPRPSTAPDPARVSYTFGTEPSHHLPVRPLVLRPRIAPGVLYRVNVSSLPPPRLASRTALPGARRGPQKPTGGASVCTLMAGEACEIRRTVVNRLLRHG